MKNILVILGTRPEAIKLAPVILELRKNPQYKVFVCNTEQQKELSNQTLGFFGITADFYLDVMQPNQTLAGVQARILTSLSEVFQQYHFDAVIVQGDTMSVFCGALVAFYNKVPVFHVEAGLRSYDLFEPFPEEAIRQMVSRITSLHFAPTKKSFDCLCKEGIEQTKIEETGNTVIDALSCLSAETMDDAQKQLETLGINLNHELVLVTAHRRENHGDRLDSILSAISELATQYPTHQFVLPVHPNPNVREKVYQTLDGVSNIVLTKPLDYPCLVAILKKTKLVLTDSGGIQEEAPTFGVPILVMRYETERIEGVTAGFAKLVGADKNRITCEARLVLDKPWAETRLDGSRNPYGDGLASERISKAIDNFLEKNLR